MAALIASDPQTLTLEPRAAFLSDDAIEILGFAARCLEEGHKAALVTLVEIHGGAARAIGAQMAVRGDGLYCGFVSGGCTEAAVAAEAASAIAKGVDRNLRLGEGSPFFDIVLPCGGGITLAIHVLRDADPLHRALAALERRMPVRLRYDRGTQALSFIQGAGPTGWENDGFIRQYRPKERLVLAGGPAETGRVAAVATAAGYEVIVVERGKVPAPGDIDADTAVAILFHDVDREVPLLEQALATDAFYIGALGSRRTHEKRCAALRERGVEAAALARIRAPIGIFDKARDSRSLAVSVVADIAQARLAGAAE